MNILKVLLRYFISFFNRIILQLLLSIVAIYTMQQAIELGNESSFQVGTYSKEVDGERIDVGTSVAMNSGYIGGSISMGIICSVCIVMIVLIELNKKKKQDQ